MKCTELEIVALDYLDGTLAGEQRVAAEAHLAACPACAGRLRQFADGFDQVQQMLDAWPVIAPSRSFDHMVLEKISESRTGWWQRVVVPLFSSLARPAFAGTLSAVLLAAVALVRFLPPAEAPLPNSGAQETTVSTLDRSDEIALVQDLNELDDLDMLRNFEVLQEMKGSTP